MGTYHEFANEAIAKGKSNYVFDFQSQTHTYTQTYSRPHASIQTQIKIPENGKLNCAE